MSNPSPLLRQTLQILDENPDTWGDVVNVSALQLLEDAISGAASVVLLSTADFTLTDTNGGPSGTEHARYGILNVTGSPGGTTNIVVPVTLVPPENRVRTKIYLVYNNTGDSSSVVVKTPAGTGPTIQQGVAQWVFCDGTNVIAIDAATATLATTATTATNALSLGGVAAANYAQLGVAQTWTEGQVVQRETVTTSMGSLAIDCSDTNAFYLLTTEAFNLTAPTNATNGQQFSIVIEQGAGGPHGITFQSNTFMFAGGTAPALSTAFGEIDYMAFEYVTGLSDLGGARWIGSIIKDVSTV